MERAVTLRHWQFLHPASLVDLKKIERLQRFVSLLIGMALTLLVPLIALTSRTLVRVP